MDLKRRIPNNVLCKYEFFDIKETLEVKTQLIDKIREAYLSSYIAQPIGIRYLIIVFIRQKLFKFVNQ